MFLRAFRAIMPQDERFITRFTKHSELIVPAAVAFRALMSGDGQAERHVAADSDDRGHQFQSDGGHHSDLMAAT